MSYLLVSQLTKNTSLYILFLFEQPGNFFYNYFFLSQHRVYRYIRAWEWVCSPWYVWHLTGTSAGHLWTVGQIFPGLWQRILYKALYVHNTYYVARKLISVMEYSGNVYFKMLLRFDFSLKKTVYSVTFWVWIVLLQFISNK